MIVVDQLSHTYGGGQQAVRGVSFQVGAGEVFGFVGPNGAGKTTTIRALATLLVPTKGRIEVCGHDAVTKPDQVRQLVGFVPDSCGVYDRLTVEEYVAFFAAAAGVEPESSRRRAVAMALELTGMAPLSGRLCGELSRGIRQRLVLARALVHDPKVLLLDEPASGLDPRARIELFELLGHLRATGKAILLSSHILTELASVVTHVGIIEKGRMVATGPARAVADLVVTDRVVLIRLLEPAAGRGKALEAQDGVVEVIEREPKLLAVTVQGDDRVVARLVRAAVEAELLVTGVECEWTDLERVFLAATQGELQ